MRVYLSVYGCPSNVADFEIASGLLKYNGFEPVNNPKKSDINIIFTCIVKTSSEYRMIYKINELTKLGKPLIVAGCMPKTSRKIIERINPDASMIGPDSIEMITEVVDSTLKGNKIIFTKDLRKPKLCLPRIRKNSIIDIVPISQGCLSNCSYCSVKFARGKLFCYPQELISKEVEQSIKNGCKEIWVTSQDNAAYNYNEHKLPELLKEICKIEGKFFIRVGMMNPIHAKPILNDLLDSYESEKVFKFLHLPVQSGSDNILKSMNRGYKVKDFIEIVKEFRKIFALTLSTDVIVGFPGESDKDFKDTIDLIKKVKPDILNISRFYPRPGTVASEMDFLDVNIINERSKIVHELARKISYEKNKKWIGWEGEVIVDENVENGFVSRNIFYKPIFINSRKKIFGEIIKIKISDSRNNFLIAEQNR